MSASVPRDVRGIAESLVDVLARAHPRLAPAVVETVVFQAAWELAGNAHRPDSFRGQLHRRANARLLAMAGTLTPISRRRAT
ncbi:hypothetical protein [Actinokineospora pegani]|uniref:hypothetical protein n=1 Tax=Actinokineospora pegani TaxID=2654637 RepID=UPI0012EAACC2|nr:hypothetical protein [Actinokineospora pegani]